MSNFSAADEGEAATKVGDTDPCIDIPGWWNYMTSQTAQTGPRSNSSPGHNTSRASCSICQQMWKKKHFKIFKLNVIIENYSIREREKKMSRLLCTNIS